MDSDTPDSPLKLYQLARNHIEHENTLMGERITWFLTMQGFLFASMYVAIGSFEKLGACLPDFRIPLFLSIVLLQVLGVISSFVCYGLLRIAQDHIQRVEEWWVEQEQKLPKNMYPEINGWRKPKKIWFIPFKLMSKLNAALFAAVIGVFWILYIGILCYSSNLVPKNNSNISQLLCKKDESASNKNPTTSGSTPSSPLPQVK